MTRRRLASGVLAALTVFAMTSCAPADPPAPAPAAPMTWSDLSAREKPTPDKSFRYGSDPYQVVDLWKPVGAGPHPVVLMVHGGCWTTSIADRTIMNWAAGDLRGRGYAVWNIDYRGVDRPEGEFAVTFRDVGNAADLLRKHAAEERLDIRRVVAVGHSAGGHLALWLGGRLGPKAIIVGRPLPIAHVVSLGGLPDLQQAYLEPQGCGKKPVVALVAGRSEAGNLTDVQLRERLAQFSVPTYAPLGVPQTLINGDADKIIPTHFATDYAARMRAKGDKVTVRIVPGQGHVELIAPGTPAWAVTVKEIDRALSR